MPTLVTLTLTFTLTFLARRRRAVDEADDEIAERRLRIADEFARGRAVGGEDDALVEARAQRIDGEHGRARVAALLVERLADDGAPAGHAGMAGGRDDGAVDAREDHGSIDAEVVDHHAAARPREGLRVGDALAGGRRDRVAEVAFAAQAEAGGRTGRS